MPPPKEVKKEEKKPDYMKMAKDYHKKSSKSAFFSNFIFPNPNVFRFFHFIDMIHSYLVIHRLLSRSYTTSVTKLTQGHFRPVQQRTNTNPTGTARNTSMRRKKWKAMTVSRPRKSLKVITPD